MSSVDAKAISTETSAEAFLRVPHSFLTFSFPRLLSHQRNGLHPVRGDDVRLHRRAAVLAVGGDDLLLQEDRGGRRGSSAGERVSDAAPLPPAGRSHDQPDSFLLFFLKNNRSVSVWPSFSCRAEYLAIASESKDNCAANVPVAE